jgi:putative flippase GtrA
VINRLGNSMDAVTRWRFARFVAFGIVNTVFGYSVYAVLILADFAPQLALVLSVAAGIVWNYFTTARFVFGQRGFRKFPAYLLCYAVIYVANAGALHFALGLGLSPLVAQAVLLPLVAVLAYVLMSYALSGQLATGE